MQAGHSHGLLRMEVQLGGLEEAHVGQHLASGQDNLC